MKPSVPMAKAPSAMQRSESTRIPFRNGAIDLLVLIPGGGALHVQACTAPVRRWSGPIRGRAWL